MSLAENISVRWSSHLETLAGRMHGELFRQSCSPFEKIVIVVNDPASAVWLKERFLFDGGKSRLLMNLEFVELSEFLNDFLEAQVHNVNPNRRRAAQHPWSPGVMTWRIYRILSEADPAGELRELLDYVGEQEAPKRRYALAEKLASLYDDYQNSRPQMLRRWETGQDNVHAGVPAWQTALCRMLAAEEPESYAKDYETVFRQNIHLPPWFRQIREIHVFDIPFMHEPMLRLLEKISEVLAVTFWCFSPQNEWLAETPSRGEMIRAVREHREKMQNGALPEEEFQLFDLAKFYDSPEERLLGAFASGARAILWNLCNDVQGNVEIADEGGDALDELPERSVALHCTYSPQRELEAVRDGLCDFFSRHPEASARDAVILCADWENYAPVVESVFGSGKSGIPVTVANSISGETPFSQSFQALLAFRGNRFEVSAVFALLGIPAIRRKFGLEAADTAILRDMVKKANIHWGYDDEDVKNLLETEADFAENCSFTWKRGFDRLTSELLGGFSDDEYALLDAGNVKGLHPCGKVEGERAAKAASLWQLVTALRDLRRDFAPGTIRPAAEMVQELLDSLDRFYAPLDDMLKEFSAARRAIRSVGEAMQTARVDTVETDVFIEAVQSALSTYVSGMRTPGNAVLFAPLNVYTAVPHDFVWICGLNDGRFPVIERRPSYDLIGKHPSFFDATSRERGAFALLKALLGARQEIALSYTGRDIRSNEEIPPSVLLSDLLDYFDAAKIAVKKYQHPMYAYSRRYFQFTKEEDKALPAACSPQDERIYRTLKMRQEGAGIIPFPLKSGGVNELSLDDLAEFFAAPNRFLIALHGAKISSAKYERFYNKERFSVSLDGNLEKSLLLTGMCDGRAAAVEVERGNAPDTISAAESMESLRKQGTRKLRFTDAAYCCYNCMGKDGKALLIADGYKALGEAVPAMVELEVSGFSIRLAVSTATVEVATESGGKLKLAFYYEPYCKSDSSKNRVWLHHLGSNAASGETATVAFNAEGFLLFAPLGCDKAKEKLTGLIRLVNTPLPFGFPCAKNLDDSDQLPPEWQQMLWSPDDVITARKISSPKSKEA